MKAIETTLCSDRLCPSFGAAAASAFPENTCALPFEPIALANRTDGWTAKRQRQFIEELADCGIVREAAARVGMTEQSAYRLRRRSDAAGFNRAWDAAVQLGVDRLHSTAFERAVAGTVRRRYFHGEVVGEERIFDNRLLIYLLGRLDKKRGYEVDRTIENWEGSMGALEDGIARPLPEPDEDHRTPVWRDKGGTWVTSFAPPAAFAGEQWGHFGEEDYCRQLAPEELEAGEAWQAHLRETSRRSRERYFARLRKESYARSLVEVSVTFLNFGCFPPLHLQGRGTAKRWRGIPPPGFRGRGTTRRVVQGALSSSTAEGAGSFSL